MRVFVSSSMQGGELEAERQAAYEALNPWFQPVMFEHSPASPRHCDEWWQYEIPKCDVFVLLVNRSLRWAVFDEFRVAQQKGPGSERTLVFVKEPEFTRGKNLEVERSPDGRLKVQEGDQEWFYRVANGPKQGVIHDIDAFGQELVAAICAIPGLCTQLDGLLPKLKKVYVEPSGFNEYLDTLERERLLFLTGPPHVGKTATGLMLLERLREAGLVQRVRSGRNLTELRVYGHLTGAGILLDDPFGGSSFSERELAENPSELQRIGADNYLVVTSREDVFAAAREGSKLREFVREETPLRMGEDSYSHAQLQDVLMRHCRYMLYDHFPQDERLSPPQVAWAYEARQDVARELQFPHNIDFFVKDLANVDNERQIRAKVRRARRIEDAVAGWFEAGSLEVQWYLCIAALFPDSDETRFRPILDGAREQFDLPYVDLSDCRTQGACYVTKDGPIRFLHSSYREGVVQALRDHWADRVARLCDRVLPRMLDEDPLDLARTIRSLPNVNFSSSWLIDTAAADAATLRALRVIRRAGEEFCTPLLEPTINRGALARVLHLPQFTVNSTVVRGCPARHVALPWTAVSMDGGPATAELLRVLRDPHRSGGQWANIGLSTTPEGVGWHYFLKAFETLLERKSLAEPWQLVWCGVYEDVKRLVDDDVLPPDVLSRPLTADDFQAQLSQGTGARVSARVIGGGLFRHLAYLDNNDHTFCGPLFPQPESPDGTPHAEGADPAYPDDLLVSVVRTYLQFLSQSCDEMCAANLPGLATHLPACRHLPWDMYATISRIRGDAEEGWERGGAPVRLTAYPVQDSGHPRREVVLFRGHTATAGNVEESELVRSKSAWGAEGALFGLYENPYGIALEHSTLRSRVYQLIQSDIRAALGRHDDYVEWFSSPSWSDNGQ